MNFKNLNINLQLIDLLKKNGIVTPTKVQEEVIPKIINKNDLIVKSKTLVLVKPYPSYYLFFKE